MIELGKFQGNPGVAGEGVSTKPLYYMASTCSKFDRLETFMLMVLLMAGVLGVHHPAYHRRPLRAHPRSSERIFSDQVYLAEIEENGYWVRPSDLLIRRHDDGFD